MKTWYQHLGFDNNPLTIKPVHNLNRFESYHDIIKKIMSTISQGKIIYIEGNYGTGKTTILKKIIKNYGGDKRIIYYNASRAEDQMDLDFLIINRTFWSRLFKYKAKDLLLLLDEAQEMTETDAKNILDHYNKGYFHSVVLVAKSKSNLPEFIHNVLGSNIFKTDVLTENEAIELIKTRLHNQELLTDEQILKLYEASERNPRKLLINTEEVCKLSLKTETKVLDKHVEEVLAR